MLDMYRRPEINRGMRRFFHSCSKWRGRNKDIQEIPRVFIPIHKGLDGFMSMDQFKKFFLAHFEGSNGCPDQ